MRGLSQSNNVPFCPKRTDPVSQPAEVINYQGSTSAPEHRLASCFCVSCYDAFNTGSCAGRGRCAAYEQGRTCSGANTLMWLQSSYAEKAGPPASFSGMRAH